MYDVSWPVCLAAVMMQSWARGWVARRRCGCASCVCVGVCMGVCMGVVCLVASGYANLLLARLSRCTNPLSLTPSTLLVLSSGIAGSEHR